MQICSVFAVVSGGILAEIAEQSLTKARNASLAGNLGNDDGIAPTMEALVAVSAAELEKGMPAGTTSDRNRTTENGVGRRTGL